MWKRIKDGDFLKFKFYSYVIDQNCKIFSVCPSDLSAHCETINWLPSS